MELRKGGDVVRLSALKDPSVFVCSISDLSFVTADGSSTEMPVVSESSSAIHKATALPFALGKGSKSKQRTVKVSPGSIFRPYLMYLTGYPATNVPCV